MKELSFLEKSELQYQGYSTLIARFSIPSMWGSQNDMFYQKFFCSKFVFFDPGETRRVEETDAQNMKNSIFYNSKYFSQFFEKFSEITMFLSRGKTDFIQKKSPHIMKLWYLTQKPCFLLLMKNMC